MAASKVDDTPFPVTGYVSPDLFCDREEEVDIITSTLKHGRHLMLYSPRRYGKTGLIHHAFRTLAKVRGSRTVFADIYAARNAHDFNQILLNAVHQALNPTAKLFMKNVMAWFASLRPVVHVDDLTGQPSIALEPGTPKQEAATTREIFRILNEQGRTIFLAIDEFQEINRFKDARLDALLRTELQNSPNVHCIFSGSQRHMLMDLFIDAKAPFYASADQLHLGPIARRTYADFAVRKMKERKRTFPMDDALFCYDLCQGHTYYVQTLYNRLYAEPGPLGRAAVIRVVQAVIRSQDAMMATFRSALTKHQWDLLAAVCREGKVLEPTAGAFIKKYDLATSATLVHALRALMDRELIYISAHDEESGKPIYVPYNPFMALWFKYRRSPQLA